MTSSEVREQILDSFSLDLVGPVAGLKAGNYLEQEILHGSTAPLRWYLTGFLAPYAAKPEETTDADSGEQIDLIPPKRVWTMKSQPQEPGPSRQTPLSSSLGSMSFSEPEDRPSIVTEETTTSFGPSLSRDLLSEAGERLNQEQRLWLFISPTWKN
jgi:hypothetical protein